MTMRTRFRDGGNSRGIAPELWNSLLLKACRGEPTPYPPVWLMRQAGRYMPSYRAIRDGRGFLDTCKDAAIAAEVTLDAQRRLGTDAAIIFADILLILEGLGMGLDYIAGDGPKLNPPLRSPADVDALGDPIVAAGRCAYVAEACALTRAGLPADCALIGFCGAPFTLASYAIEGGSSRQFALTRRFMYEEEAAWNRLCERLVAALIPYCTAQVEAGAQAIQLFDSWAGALTAVDYERWVLPHLKALVQALPEGIPVFVFGTHTGHLLPLLASTGCDVLGIDSNTDLVTAWESLGGPGQLTVQGNLDPGLLLGSEERLCAEYDRLAASVAERPGWICNLGHGIFKETDQDRAIALVKHIQRR
jgi:uroporphyrinogen decarboxylase